MRILITLILSALIWCSLFFYKSNDVAPVESEPQSISKEVACPDCGGSGTMVCGESHPLVEMELVPVGYSEPCQSCRSTGKMTEVTLPNGMVYHTNGQPKD